jgi:hypothetical protein
MKHWLHCGFLLFTMGFSSFAIAEERTTYRGMGTTKQEFPTFKALKAGGYIAKKPEIFRYDYNDVYTVKKPIKFMGQTVVAISDEYMSEYIGCCVSEGWGAVLSKKSDLAALQQFTKQHQCSLKPRGQEASDYYDQSLKSYPRAEYYELSCRERDLAQY